MEHEIPAGLGRSPWYPLLLAVIFVVCFSLSVFLGIKVGMRFVDRNGASGEPEAELVPEIARIDGDLNFIRVKNSAELVPQSGRDFLITVWVKFKRLPAPGQRVVFLGKTDWSDSRHAGYSLSLTREGNTFRPTVYWQPPIGGNVGVLTFSEMQIVPQRWVLFALSVKDNRFLGLHTAQLLDGKTAEVRLAGGFDVQNAAPPENKVDLLVGAFGSSSFRGAIGPLGVFAPEQIHGDVKKVLKEVVKDPLDPPSVMSERDVRLWAANPSAMEFAARIQLEKQSASSTNRDPS